MTFEEFSDADDLMLLLETKACFDEYNDPNTGGLDKPALLLEAQFYIQELGRREDSRIARRDFRMELVVIFLIGLELVAAVVLAIWGGREQDRANQKQLTALGQVQGNLSNLNESSKATADTLTQLKAVTETMNGAIQKEVALFYDIRVNIVYEQGSKTLLVINNGRTSVTLWGVKVGDDKVLMMIAPQIMPPSGSYNFTFEGYQKALADTLAKGTSKDLVFVLLVSSEKKEHFTIHATLTALWQGDTLSFNTHINEIIPGWER